MNGKEDEAIFALARPIATKMKGLSIEGRMTLLVSLLTQEMCKLPQAERQSELRRVVRDLPAYLAATEEGLAYVRAWNGMGGRA